MKPDAHEQPLVFVKDALGGAVHAEGVSRQAGDCGRGHACNFCPKEMRCRIDKPAHNETLINSRLSCLRRIVSPPCGDAALESPKKGPHSGLQSSL